MIIKFKDLRNEDLVIWKFKYDAQFNEEQTLKILDKNKTNEFGSICHCLSEYNHINYLTSKDEINEIVFKLLKRNHKDEDDMGLDFL